MSKSIEPADRRPLVYGVFVLLILVAASYLFWPRTPKPESLVLTPESVRSGPVAADMSGDVTEAEAAAGDLESVEPDGAPTIAEETHISDAPVEEPAPAVEPAPSQPAPDRSEPARANALAGNGPSATGGWVLNVGAFSTESAARKRAEDLSRQGMAAHVHRVVADGRSLWRVRVGYFATKAKATEYGSWMKSTHGIEGWPSSR